MLNRREFFKAAVIFTLFPSDCIIRTRTTTSTHSGPISRESAGRETTRRGPIHVITEPCVDYRCESYNMPQCVTVCPVDAIQDKRFAHLRPEDALYKYYITDECINCGACVPECPREAITPGDEVYEIEAAKCTDCIPFYDVPQCADVCPVDACVPRKATYKRPEDDPYKNMFYITKKCIGCGACESKCPVNAIFPVDEVPEKWKHFIRYNALAF